MRKRILALLDGWPFLEAILPHVKSPVRNTNDEIMLVRLTGRSVLEFSFVDQAISANPILEIKHKNYLDLKNFQNWRPHECASPVLIHT